MSIKQDILNKLGVDIWRTGLYMSYLDTRIHEGFIQYRIKGDVLWTDAAEVDEAKITQDIELIFGVNIWKQADINRYVEITYNGEQWGYRLIGNVVFTDGQAPEPPLPDDVINPDLDTFTPLRTFTIEPSGDGHVIIDGSAYQPGDLLLLSGDFLALRIDNLIGTAENPICIQNTPGEIVTIGDQSWEGGSWAEALSMFNCKHFIFWGTTVKSLVVNGTLSAVENNRTAYFNVIYNDYTDNFRACYFTIKNGGTGFWCKKEVELSDPNSYGDNPLQNIEIDHILIQDTYNEGMYLGHTADYWDTQTDQPFYPEPGDPEPDPARYKRPIRIENLNVHHNLVRRTGGDGIQIASSDGVLIENNEIYDYATRHDVSHNAGIIFGRITGGAIKDNYIHDGWGDMMQAYASGPCTIENNLLVNNQNEGISVRTRNDAVMSIKHNTVANPGQTTIRINGNEQGAIIADPNQSPHLVNANILAAPLNEFLYIYKENQGKATEGVGADANLKQMDLTGIDVDNWYLPESSVAGYRHTSEIGMPILNDY